ncbi:glycosyltransferase family 9 protein [Roseomonas marmotae]|uniref:Glycosyltransferase family 9 protein n=1 Tax=Roseomonas marmotae TaxID=2768161 RepID=A0ABS3KE27_9PROT|nr:glycosyltransferase family 9 protein [Roseomonas marmotae]MBO1075700.1 glycosyltransferase family 9 protein [Roseomonas marmotae]QTI80431.1 glycosyltransferase family 9 protein [Roseomonas marmotae]
MRILFITSTRIGDAVLSTGLLDHLLRTHPDARVTVACGPVAEGVFTRMPNRDETIVLVKQRFSAHWLGLWAKVARMRWDLVVDLRGSALAWLVPARRRAVMQGGRRPGHRLLHIAGTLGLVPAPRPVAWFGPEDMQRARRLLGEDGRPLIALGPSANWAGKVWPAERFVELFRALSAPDGPLPGARAVVLGGPGQEEAAMAAPVLAALPEAVDLVGKLDLPAVAAALTRCALFVGNDSGLMHLAAAAGTPTLGLFGPTPASEYAPVGRAARAVLARGTPGAAPMEDLPVEDALAAARALLAGDAA